MPLIEPLDIISAITTYSIALNCGIHVVVVDVGPMFGCIYTDRPLQFKSKIYTSLSSSNECCLMLFEMLLSQPLSMKPDMNDFIDYTLLKSSGAMLGEF